MAENDYIWLKMSYQEREELIKLLLSNQRVNAIKHVRALVHLDLRSARQFVDSPWLLKKLCEADPTRKPPKAEFKVGVLQIATDMLGTIGKPDMMAKDKYELLVNDVTELFDLCMEG